MKKKIFVIAHNIRSAYNIGSIFRSADAFGIEKIYLTGYSPDPSNKKVLKTSLGSEKTVNWEKNCNISDAIAVLKKNAVKIIALEESKKRELLHKFKTNDKVAIILGNEVDGIEDEVLKEVDCCLEIQMLGEKESLNVAVCGGVAMYHFRYLS